MKLISWNVNGLRAVLQKGFLKFLNTAKPDILGLQEIKISHAKKEELKFVFPDYDEFWNPAQRPGYSGTLILYKKGLKVISLKNGFGQSRFDDEGRVQTLELEKLFFLNIYFPNANPTLGRLKYKLEFNRELLKYIKKLEKFKPIIITGDFNVAHEEIDLARPEENEGSAGFTIPERQWFSDFLSEGFTDSFREIHGDKIKYSWWSFRAGARQRNVGWRIDYFCLSDKLKKNLQQSDILDKVIGSDHAPVVLEIK